jgi:HSP20 family protein
MANIVRRREGGIEGRGWDPFHMMQELLRWDPFGETAPFHRPPERAGFIPSFEVKEAGDHYEFKADLPGVKEEDLDISLTGSRLTVSGTRDEEERREGETYYAYERSYGGFTRSFTLPEGVDDDHVTAELKNGVLHLVIPKLPEVQSKRIALKGKPASKA